MPISECKNGKFRIGTGPCIYDTKEKAEQVWSAIKAHGTYALDRNKVSYAWDALKNNQRVITQFRVDSVIKDVYIISNGRHGNNDTELLRFLDYMNFNKGKVYFTNGAYKWMIIRHLGIGVHYDNNQTEVSLINTYTECEGRLI